MRRIPSSREWTVLLAIGAAWISGAPARAAEGDPGQVPESRRIHVDVGGGPAPEVLNAIASQAGWQLLYPYDLVAGRQLPPVKGDYTLAEILDRIGLSRDMRAETGDGVVIRLVARPAARPETPPIPPSLSGEEIAEIIIGGFRHSIEAALDRKRTAPAEVDAINSEDIGRFPDKNVADSLQRLPGISVDRFWGEGRDIYIRGTDNTLNRTQMNGQNVASAYWWANDNPSRGFNYDILASELVKSVEVYKSPTADLDEGSIGGLVIVRTRRPLDMPRDWTLEASAEGLYSVLPGQVDPNASILLSWQNENRTFGVLGSLIYQERHIRRDGLESFADSELYSLKDQNGRLYNGVYVPFEGGSAMFRQDKKRWTENLTLQARPTPEWDLTVNLVNASEQEDNNNQNYLWLGGAALSPNVTGAADLVADPRFITTSDGHLALVGGTVGLPSEAHAAYEPIYRDAYVDSHVVDFDAQHTSGPWTLHLQTGLTWAAGGSSRDYHTWFQGDGTVTINLGPSTNEFTFNDLNPQNPAALTLQHVADYPRRMTENESYAQGDVSYELGAGPLRAIKAGIKYRDDEVTNTQSTFPGNGAPDAGYLDISLAEVSSGLTPPLQQAARTSGTLTRYAMFSPTLAQQVIAPLTRFPVIFNKAAYFDIEEKILAGYVRADLEGERWHANLGVRAIHTNQQSTAYILGFLGSADHPYDNLLPSLNVSYDLSSDVRLRGALSQVMARNTWQNLSSNVVQDQTIANQASAGNPNLKPIRANQAEAGVEWYRGAASMLGGTLFAKQLDTIIYTQTAPEIVNGTPYSVTRPYNSDRGASILGLELQVQQELFWGFGVSSNYTYTQATAPAVPGLPDMKLQGNSRHQANASLYYNLGPFEARFSVNYRSAAYGALLAGSQAVTDPYTQLDATASYALNENAQVFFTAVNITDETLCTHTADGLPLSIYENGSRYSAGVRIKF